MLNGYYIVTLYINIIYWNMFGTKLGIYTLNTVQYTQSYLQIANLNNPRQIFFMQNYGIPS